jgi:predicted RNase H-like HicB family nuclease
MTGLPYSLVIEATDALDFFGFYSPDLEGFTGIGRSVEDCLEQARWGMQEFLEIMAERNMPIPPRNEEPTLLITSTRKDPTGQQAPAPVPQHPVRVAPLRSPDECDRLIHWGDGQAPDSFTPPSARHSMGSGPRSPVLGPSRARR